MTTLATDFYPLEERPIPPGLDPYLAPDVADEPELPCDACGALVVWAPRRREFLDVETVGPHECQP